MCPKNKYIIKTVNSKIIILFIYYLQGDQKLVLQKLRGMTYDCHEIPIIFVTCCFDCPMYMCRKRFTFFYLIIIINSGRVVNCIHPTAVKSFPIKIIQFIPTGFISTYVGTSNLIISGK